MSSILKGVFLTVFCFVIISLPGLGKAEQPQRVNKIARLNNRMKLLYLLAIRAELQAMDNNDPASDSLSAVTTNDAKETGWSANSIGYNGGLGALQKIFGKRGRNNVYENVDLSSNDEYTKLFLGYLQFLEMKENGTLEPNMLRCLMSETNRKEK